MYTILAYTPLPVFLLAVLFLMIGVNTKKPKKGYILCTIAVLLFSLGGLFAKSYVVGGAGFIATGAMISFYYLKVKPVLERIEFLPRVEEYVKSHSELFTEEERSLDSKYKNEKTRLVADLTALQMEYEVDCLKRAKKAKKYMEK